MKSGPHKIFVDTNVWFSFFYGSENCEKLINAHIQGNIKAVISRQILEETIRNIKEKIPDTIPTFENFIKQTPPIIIKDAVNINKQVYDLVSKEDVNIFAAFLTANIKYFVTGNIKDFKRVAIKKRLRIEVLTPKEMVEKLGL